MTYKSRNNFRPIALLIILLLLGIVGYQWYNNQQLKSKAAALESDLFDVEKIQTELEQDYQAALEDLEDMRGDNQELNDLIDQQKKDLLAQKAKISNLIWTQRELGKAQEEMERLRDLADQYIQEAADLKRQNEMLLAENSKLVADRNELQKKYSTEKEANEQLVVDRAKLAEQKEMLASKNQELNVKVDIAKAIKVKQLEVQGYKINRRGKERKRRRAGSIDMIRICFVTETNIVAPAGETEFQVRIIDPLGETMYVDNLTGGMITDKLTNRKVRYTTSGIMDYKNQDTRGCIDWDVPFKLAGGTYEVQVYNNGFLVGEQEYSMR